MIQLTDKGHDIFNDGKCFDITYNVSHILFPLIYIYHK